MKKTFRKAIACLLAVLMVALSFPFTASAVEINRKWWEAEGVEAVKRESDGLYMIQYDHEPDYMGANSMDNSVTGPMGLPWGYDISGGIYEYDCRDYVKPIFAITVSNQGTATDGTFTNTANQEKPKYDNAIYNKYYGATTAYDYDTVKAAGNILNPADLKAGQRIAITFEWGGLDCYESSQFKVNYDTDYLMSAKYTMMPSAFQGDTWKEQTTANGGQLKTCSDYYSGVVLTGTININTTTGDILSAQTSSNMTAGVTSPQFAGTSTVDELQCGGARPFGKYGLILTTLSFEVLQDCDLADVLTFNSHYGESYLGLYNQITVPEGDPFRVAFSDHADDNSVCAITPIVFDSYDAGATEPVQHVHDFTGAVPVSNDNGTHTLTCTAADCDLSDGYQQVVNCTFPVDGVVTKPASCTEAGIKTYTCTECGYSYEEAIEANGHTADYAGATCDWLVNEETGYDYVATVKCSACSEVVETIKANVEVSSTTATCTQAGSTTYTATFDNTQLKGDVKVVEGELAPHTYTTQASDVQAKPATCTEAATYYVKCDVCGHVSDTETVAVGEPLGHDFTVDSGIMVSPATCEQKQLNKAKCSRCGEVSEEVTIAVGELAAHTPVLDESTAVEPTFDAPGKYADTVCSVCGETLEEGAVRPAIAYYTITATSENGTATANGEASVKVAVNGDVTLAATPATEGLEFVGWSLNDKIVSTEETYTTVAIANADYVAIYKEAETEFTVVFTDQYGNVYGTWTGSDASTIDIPADPTLVGFTFKGWSMDEEAIKALDTSATIMAIFERTAADDKFNVTVNGDCTIDGTEEKTLAVNYNTQVTVNAPAGATNGTWKVDGAAVAYGTSYTFFVGADITLTFEEDALVTAEPTVASVSMDKDPDSFKVAFLATRSVVDDYKYVSAGFVYGKNMTEDDLSLDNVGKKGSNGDSGNVKVLYCSTDSEQFRLSYGITAQTGSASVKPFLAYMDAEGETFVIYGATQTYVY